MPELWQPQQGQDSWGISDDGVGAGRLGLSEHRLAYVGERLLQHGSLLPRPAGGRVGGPVAR